MKPEPILTGGCLCGRIRYRAAAPPVDAQFCHCRMCQRAQGAAFAIWFSVPAAALQIVRGEPAWYRSSSFARRGFCGDCGSPLFFVYEASDMPGISIASLDDPAAVAPEAHWGVESLQPWLAFADRLPHCRTDDDPEFRAASATSTK